MRFRLAALWALLPILVGCYGSLPPEPPCQDPGTTDSVRTEVRIDRDLSRRPRHVWRVRRDSTGSWIRHGRDIHYFLTGQPSAVESYRDGLLDGEASYWHENGAKQGEIRYERGLAQGVARTWHPDGGIEAERHWKHGKLDGLERRWDRRGRVVLEIDWIDGRVSGRRAFDP